MAPLLLSLIRMFAEVVLVSGEVTHLSYKTLWEDLVEHQHLNTDQAVIQTGFYPPCGCFISPFACKLSINTFKQTSRTASFHRLIFFFFAGDTSLRQNKPQLLCGV